MKKKLKKLPEIIRNRIVDLTNGMVGEYKQGFLNGVVFLQELLEEFESCVEKEALRRAEKWFEEEVVKTHSVDELYTGELEESHGIPCLKNIRPEWAHQFFQRVEMEKETLKNEYSQKASAKGNNSREDLGL